MTDLATFGFDEETGEMTLLTVHPGVSVDDVRANMNWEPRVSESLGQTPPPTEGEPIPAGQNAWISRPDGRIRQIWTSPTDYR